MALHDTLNQISPIKMIFEDRLEFLEVYLHFLEKLELTNILKNINILNTLFFI